jgi:cysteine desulfurase/selenocysteine lyase
MLDTVGFDGTTFSEPPYRFESGTWNLPGAVGLAAALKFLEGVGRRIDLDRHHPPWEPRAMREFPRS